MSEITVRAAEPADVPALVLLWEELNRAGHAADPRFRVHGDARATFAPHIHEMWCCQDPFPGAFVAVQDEKLVGFVAGTLVRPNPLLAPVAEVVIEDLFVAEAARRQGIGRRLVDAFVAATAAAGYRGVQVGTLVKDERAVTFWRALGFDDMRVTLVRA